MVSGEYRTELLKEVRVNGGLKDVARKIKDSPNDVDRKKKLLSELRYFSD